MYVPNCENSATACTIRSWSVTKYKRMCKVSIAYAQTKAPPSSDEEFGKYCPEGIWDGHLEWPPAVCGRAARGAAARLLQARQPVPGEPEYLWTDQTRPKTAASRSQITVAL